VINHARWFGSNDSNHFAEREMDDGLPRCGDGPMSLSRLEWLTSRSRLMAWGAWPCPLNPTSELPNILSAERN
jgi:hypothetical protein